MIRINELKLFLSFLIVLLSTLQIFGQTTQTLGDKVTLAIKKELPELVTVQPMILLSPYLSIEPQIESRWKTEDGRKVSINFHIDKPDKLKRNGLMGAIDDEFEGFLTRSIVPPYRRISDLGDNALLVSHSDVVEIRFYKENIRVDINFGFTANRQVGFYGPAPKEEEDAAIRIAQVIAKSINKRITTSPCFNDFQKPPVFDEITVEDKLFAAIIRAEVKQVEEISKNPINFNATLTKENFYVKTSGSEENKVMHIAANQGCLEILKILVAVKADVNIRNRWGQTPLMFAVREGNLENIRFLIDSGADVNLKFYGRNAAFYALEIPNSWTPPLKPKLEIFNFLVKSGLNPNVKDNEGKTLLTSLVCYEGEYCRKWVETLLKQGVDVNAQDNKGNSALILFSEGSRVSYYVKEDIVKIFRLFVEYGADVNLRNKENKSALDYLLIQQQTGRGSPILEDVIKILKDAGAK